MSNFVRSETNADWPVPHLVSLPTGDSDYVSQIASGTHRPGGGFRDLGIAEVTGGKFGSYIGKAPEDGHYMQGRHGHKLDFQQVFVLSGFMRMWYDGIGEIDCPPGTSVYEAPGRAHEIAYIAKGTEVLAITSPAVYSTFLFPPGKED